MLFVKLVGFPNFRLSIARGNSFLCQTKEILHYFDCPYQLASDSPDRAKDATKLTFPLQPGDIILKGGLVAKPLQWLRRFDEFEALLDDNVKGFVVLEICDGALGV